jgi:hypothetical protein
MKYILNAKQFLPLFQFNIKSFLYAIYTYMANVMVVLIDSGVAPPAPVINAFSPYVGASGATVFITGSSFAGATDVQFNGTSAASFTIVNDNLIVAILPNSFTSGNIAVIGSSTTTSTDRFGKLGHGFEGY